MAKSKESDPGFVTINFRCLETFAGRIDARIEAMNRETPGAQFSRSSLIRVAVEAYLGDAPTAPAAKPKPKKTAK